MNDSELKQYCLEHAGEELPAEAEAYLKRHPELKREVDRLVAVQALMSLKRYERPSPGAVDRCIRGVQEAVAKDRLSWRSIIREWIDFEPAAVRYAGAAAALVLCAAGVSLLTTMQKAPLPLTESAEPPSELQAAPEPVVLAPEPVLAEVVEPEPEPVNMLAELEKPIIVLQVNSNPQPSRSSGMTIGGGQVMPVSFER